MTTTQSVAVVVAAAGGVLLAAVGQPGWAALVILVGTGAAIVPIDLRQRRIPTPLVATAAGATLIVCAITAARQGSWAPLGNAALGTAIAGGSFLAVHLVHPAGLGFGDVRLAALAGALAAYGTADVAVAIVAIAFAAIASGLVTVARRERSAPFAPYLLGASAIAVVVSLWR